MAATYAAAKAAVIDVVDDFTPLDITAGYGSKYNAKSKLEKIGLGDAVLAVMPPRFNKVMRKIVGATWNPVGPLDTVACATIGDLIELACGQGGLSVPAGEPT